MTLIGLGLNFLLAGLLVAALALGMRLNGRLKVLRDSHDGFEAAVRELNLAAQRAEQGLADLRAATDEATDMLSDRIEKGRGLATRLERLIGAAPELPAAAERAQPARNMPPVMPAPRETATQERLAGLLAMARARIDADNAAVEGRPAAAQAASHRADPLVGRTPLPGRRIAAFDEDLFEDEPLVLDRFAGAGR